MNHQLMLSHYVWLIQFLQRRGRATLTEIQDAWRRREEGDGRRLARATFSRYKDAILILFGIQIECDERDGYRYYIGNMNAMRRDDVRRWMLSTIGVSNLLTEHKGLHDRILLEEVPSGEEWLDAVLEAMRSNTWVWLTYHKYGQEEAGDQERLVAPLCVKLHLRRWYVLVLVEDGGTRLFSLDRVRAITPTQRHFTVPEAFDARTYFKDVVGVVTQSDQPRQRIVIRAFRRERFYLRDLPLHPSQREIATTEEYADFEYMMVPTSELDTHLLSRGRLELVLEPQWLADKIREKHQLTAEKYGTLRE